MKTTIEEERTGLPKEKILSFKTQGAIESWMTTCETLSDPELLKDIKEGLEDLKAGRISQVRDDLKKCLK